MNELEIKKQLASYVRLSQRIGTRLNLLTAAIRSKFRYTVQWDLTLRRLHLPHDGQSQPQVSVPPKQGPPQCKIFDYNNE
jgi:hypothetical protein